MQNNIQVLIKRLDHSKGLPLPEAQTDFSAGVDLSAANTDPIIIKPTECKIIPTGLLIALPSGYEAQIRPRSGLAIKHGITVLNSPGTIDSDYRGEIGIILINHGNDLFTIKRGARIAQMVIAKHEQANWTKVETLEETERGVGGFGSTGVK